MAGRARAFSTALRPAAAPSASRRVNSLHQPEPLTLPEFVPKDNQFNMADVSTKHWSDEAWSTEALRAAQHSHVVGTWAPSKAMADFPIIERSEGVYLYDREGKQYIDWTSQAVCTNLGHDVPPAVVDAVRWALGQQIKEQRQLQREVQRRTGRVYPRQWAAAPQIALHVRAMSDHRAKNLTASEQASQVSEESRLRSRAKRSARPPSATSA